MERYDYLRDCICELVSIAEEFVERERFGELDNAGADIIGLLIELNDLKDAEEQGLLLRLPCKVGDTIYIIDDLNNMVLRGTVKGFTEDKIRTARGYLIHVKYKNSVASESWEEFSEVGKTVFLTKEEAEQKLAEMKGE